ncbi:PREDICTED: serpin E3 isoform X1 [Crocodylus porosus]|uniref:serpin E3 isoform X1 n=1 Tax=Crocodylus porosus TaxID=8502 RepID=UPI00093B748E|nr:PREDICTED: serpin E3 isoform X1 [Crocodylus porosus]XP_019385527.1 PREDICTED: serpin E3 isoform X1 [Crocodylus porosus]XP_019385528.1 PREDICTED: serpin E3 isoform X1 [Crocodylus porosus]
MLSILLPWLILYSCFLNNGSCDLYHELKELMTEFAINLYQQLADPENRTNLIISPASVIISLELLQFGAQGNTFAQLENALGFNIHDERVQDFMRAVHEEMTNTSQGTVVQLACALFIQASVHLSPFFIEHATLWANSSLQQTNFSEPNRTAAQISEWVSSNIGDEEADSISLERASSPLNQIAVVSTLYFKSMWQKKFFFTDTQPLAFTTAEGFILKVPTMYQTADVNYGQFHTASLEQFSVIELPYLGETVSMFVVLPSDRRTSLSHIESHLSAKTITLWANNLKRIKMDIFLPRFSIQSHFDLKWILPMLGITDIFDPSEADFKGISEQGNLYISEAIHKAKIEIEEDGTNASGATAMVLLKRSRTPIFKADRPFIFFLRQANTGSVLFIGRITNPSQ